MAAHFEDEASMLEIAETIASARSYNTGQGKKDRARLGYIGEHLQHLRTFGFHFCR